VKSQPGIDSFNPEERVAVDVIIKSCLLAIVVLGRKACSNLSVFIGGTTQKIRHNYHNHSGGEVGNIRATLQP
jgi:hypothetical protein